MIKLIIFFVSLLILIIGIFLISIRLNKNKDYVSLLLVILTILSMGYLSFGWGTKYVHINYVKAYFNPSKKLLSHFSILLDTGKMNQVRDEIKIINQELQKVYWRDQKAYSDLVDKVVGVD